MVAEELTQWLIKFDAELSHPPTDDHGR